MMSNQTNRNRAYANGQRRVTLVLLIITIFQPSCSVVSTKPLGLSSDAQVTENLGEIAATGDTSSCGDCGCHDAGEVPGERPPAELTKMSLPTYRIEPPDVLLINAISVTPPNP